MIEAKKVRSFHRVLPEVDVERKLRHRCLTNILPPNLRPSVRLSEFSILTLECI